MSGDVDKRMASTDEPQPPRTPKTPKSPRGSQTRTRTLPSEFGEPPKVTVSTTPARLPAVPDTPRNRMSKGKEPHASFCQVLASKTTVDGPPSHKRVDFPIGAQTARDRRDSRAACSSCEEKHAIHSAQSERCQSNAPVNWTNARTVAKAAKTIGYLRGRNHIGGEDGGVRSPPTFEKDPGGGDCPSSGYRLRSLFPSAELALEVQQHTREGEVRVAAMLQKLDAGEG